MKATRLYRRDELDLITVPLVLPGQPVRMVQMYWPRATEPLPPPAQDAGSRTP